MIEICADALRTVDGRTTFRRLRRKIHVGAKVEVSVTLQHLGSELAERRKSWQT